MKDLKLVQNTLLHPRGGMNAFPQRIAIESFRDVTIRQQNFRGINIMASLRVGE